MSDEFTRLGELASRIVERLEANERRFVIPNGDGPTVTMRVSDYEAMLDKIAGLKNALDRIQRLNQDVAGWKPRAVEAQRIAVGALIDHG